MNAAKTCSVILSRPLELAEQEIFLFPRVCRRLGCFSPGEAGSTLEVCEGCLATAWCRDQCRAEGRLQHSRVCRNLRQVNIIMSYCLKSSSAWIQLCIILTAVSD